MSASAALPGARLGRRIASRRWLHLAAGVAAMTVAAGALYGWPLLVKSPGAPSALSSPGAQDALAAFILGEALLAPLESWLGTRLRTWILVAAGAGLMAIGSLAGLPDSAGRARIAWYGLGGIGAGVLFGGTVARAARLFGDCRAVCVAATAGACVALVALGLGAILATAGVPVHADVLAALGAAQAAVVAAATLYVLDPLAGRSAAD